MRGGEARAERNSRSGGTRSQRVLERMLSRDGIRIRTYDYISHYRARGAHHIICFENRCELGTIETPQKIPHLRNFLLLSYSTISLPFMPAAL